jgi:hypothetical protein
MIAMIKNNTGNNQLAHLKMKNKWTELRDAGTDHHIIFRDSGVISKSTKTFHYFVCGLIFGSVRNEIEIDLERWNGCWRAT